MVILLKKKLLKQVKCELCGKSLKAITPSHLHSQHEGMTLWQYKKLFPNSPTVSKKSMTLMRKAALHRHEASPLTKKDKKRISTGMKKYWKVNKGARL